MTAEIKVDSTPIPGLHVMRLTVHDDARGWFKEDWHRAKMAEAGLPDFGPVQHNIAFNTRAGITRGIHAEPWDKLVSVATGRVFAAWVDLRAGETFGTTYTTELDPTVAVFVPRGVANSYQTLEDGTAYSYLVNAHWSPDAEYTHVNLADPAVNIDWPLPLANVSDKDRDHPSLADVTPVAPKRTVILGANGQLGRALRELLPDALALSRAEADLLHPASLARVRWDEVDTIINAAAFTDVDGAETPDGRREAWAVNVAAVAALARIAIEHRLTLVTVSSDYVFDGTRSEHPVDEEVSPLSVYGQTKAAGEAVTSTVPRHYIVRTSWVVGDGTNFIATMQRLARQGVSPHVVDDQIGIVTPAEVLAEGIVELVASGAPFGIHHITGEGPPKSWAEIAREVFASEGRDPNDVVAVSTEAYGVDKQLAPRPRHSTLVPRTMQPEDHAGSTGRA